MIPIFYNQEKEAQLEDFKRKVNELINEYGFICVGYKLPREINQITPLSFKFPELGNCLIIAYSSIEEFKQHWRSKGFKCELANQASYYYHAIID